MDPLYEVSNMLAPRLALGVQHESWTHAVPLFPQVDPPTCTSLEVEFQKWNSDLEFRAVYQASRPLVPS